MVITELLLIVIVRRIAVVVRNYLEFCIVVSPYVSFRIYISISSSPVKIHEKISTVSFLSFFLRSRILFFTVRRSMLDTRYPTPDARYPTPGAR